jgi:hypothetical protein
MHQLRFSKKLMEEFPISTIRTHETYKGHVRQYCMFSTVDFVLHVFLHIFSSHIYRYGTGSSPLPLIQVAHLISLAADAGSSS